MGDKKVIDISSGIGYNLGAKNACKHFAHANGFFMPFTYHPSTQSDGLKVTQKRATVGELKCLQAPLSPSDCVFAFKKEYKMPASNRTPRTLTESTLAATLPPSLDYQAIREVLWEMRDLNNALWETRLRPDQRTKLSRLSFLRLCLWEALQMPSPDDMDSTVEALLEDVDMGEAYAI